MTAEELQDFIEAAKLEREFGVFFVTLGKTGLRPSEAIALTVSDLRHDKRVLRVSKAYLSGRVRHHTKTGVSREVGLSPELHEMLRAHIARLREEAFKKGKPMPEMLFLNRAGTYIDWNNAADAFHRICKKAKIGRFRPYDLRHTLASLLLAGGAPITYVAAQLGHSKPTTTLRYYARWLPGENRHYVELLDRRSEASDSVSAVV
jgi:integrase